MLTGQNLKQYLWMGNMMVRQVRNFIKKIGSISYTRKSVPFPNNHEQN